MLRAILSAMLLTTSIGIAAAQPTTLPPSTGQRADCPPGTGPNAPAVGRDSKNSLSDQLAASKGVICPPAGIDPEIRQRPPEGGAMKIIPPPGTPGGDPSVQPK